MSDDPIGAIEAAQLRTLVERAHDAFATARDEIDELNVFPVPDGDTGTNLVMTVRTVRDEIADVDDDDLPRALGKGALMGARGNSGVIFSQVIRAFADTFGERGSLDAPGVAAALDRARDLAYDAVANPVEGTMLTVIAAAAEHAAEHTDDGLAALTAAVRDRLAEAVAATEGQLEELEEAGVVDAGARGFEVFWDALHRFVTGEDAAAPDAGEQRPAPVVDRSGPEVRRESGSSAYRFEVQYLLAASDDAIAPLRDRLSELGDSVVVVGAGDLLNVHVHTNDIGPAIEAGVEHGRPSRIEVTEFAEQVERRRRDGGEEPPVGVVAVLPGEGLRAVAEEHGATAIAGRAGDLPSVADLLAAVGNTPGERIILLPGHPNAVPAAEQAARLSREEGDRPIEIVASATSAPAVLAALSVGADAAAMDEAAAAVAVGEVVAAVRDAETPIGDVRSGQFLVSVGGRVAAAFDDPVDALERLAGELEVAGSELVTLIVGADVDPEERERAVEVLSDAATSAELDVVDGGQWPARYLVGAE